MKTQNALKRTYAAEITLVNGYSEGYTIYQIAKITKKSEVEIKEIIEKHLNK
jgi:hypothetical protein